MQSLTQTSAWQALEQHRREFETVSLRRLFQEDPQRYQRYSFETDGLLVDLSKTHLTGRTLELLLDLARAADLERWREKLFWGERINHTEGRAVLHTVLRAPDGEPVKVDGQDARAEVREALQRMERLVEAVRAGEYRGYSGEAITDVVHIGIGGSDLGPRLVVEALGPYVDGPRLHFVANVDGVELSEALRHLDPAKTLFLMVSKSFGTRETLANAEAARDWFLQRCGEPRAVARHFLAVTANIDKAVAFGVDREQILPMWDWVGGRYSLWSAVGLPIALAVGMERFRELLEGAHQMDRHFRQAPVGENLPVLLGLLGIWYDDFFDAGSLAVVPYTERLRQLPNYLQQLDMESNGKTVDRNGQAVDYQTAPAIWGQTGTNGQHAFFQALHQGSRVVPVDFIGVAEPASDLPQLHDDLVANLFAQAQALMWGRTAEEARAEMEREGRAAEEIERLLPYRVFPGNRPSTMILLRSLSPYNLGQLIALYEHKVFVQGVVWRLNSFDQWGVELGKQLAQNLMPALKSAAAEQDLDPSTAGLVARYRDWRGRS